MRSQDLPSRSTHRNRFYAIGAILLLSIAQFSSAGASMRADTAQMYITPMESNFVEVEPVDPHAGYSLFNSSTSSVIGTGWLDGNEAGIDVEIDMRSLRRMLPDGSRSGYALFVFNPARYPDAELSLRLAGVPGVKGVPDSVTATGTLTLCGVRQPVSASVSVDMMRRNEATNEAMMRVSGTIPVNIADYRPELPARGPTQQTAISFSFFASPRPNYPWYLPERPNFEWLVDRWMKENELRSATPAAVLAGPLSIHRGGNIERLLNELGISSEEFCAAALEHTRELDRENPESEWDRGNLWKVIGPLTVAAGQEAWKLDERQRIRPHHFILAILKQDSLWTTQWLAENGVTYDGLRYRYDEHPRPANSVTLVGNPFHPDERADSAMAYSRSVWDMILHDGKLWFGHGDFGRNTGPTDLITYDPASDRFAVETTLPDECISRFRVINGNLYTPGTDPKESWDFGNIYRQTDSGEWETVRKMPHMSHITDVIEHDGALWTSGLHRSRDGGETWDRAAPYEPHVSDFLKIDDELYGISWERYAFHITNASVEPVRVDFFPDSYPVGRAEVMQAVEFGDTAVWVASDGGIWREGSLGAYTADRVTNIRRIALPRGTEPWDVITHDGTAYLLCNRRQGGGLYTVIIYRSSDLTRWTEFVRFDAPERAQSFEYVGDDSQAGGQAFYVGLGTLPEIANPHSGDILRVVPPGTPD